MKKTTTVTMFLLILSSVPCLAFNPLSFLFGGGDIKTDVKNLKDSTEKSFSDLKLGLNDNNLKASALSDNVTKINSNLVTQGNELGVMKENVANLSAKLESQAGVLSGVNNSISKIEARDVTQNSHNAVTNEGSVMTGLLTVATNGFTYVIGLLMAYIVRLSYHRSKLENRIMDFVSIQEDGQSKYIAVLEKIAFHAIGLDEKEIKQEVKDAKIEV